MGKLIAGIAGMFFLVSVGIPVRSQDAQALANKVRAKLGVVKDYVASGSMKTDVSFMKVPVSGILVFYRKPDQFKIRKQDGIAVTPKGGVSVNLNALLASDHFTAVMAGNGMVNNQPVTIIKLLPLDEKSPVVLSTLYIDEKNLLIRKAITNTRDNGTYEMQMEYGRYANYGLPDKVIFTFNTRDYKLPKGLAFDYDTGSKPEKPADGSGQTARIEIIYTSYEINKGLSEPAFR